MGKTFTRFSAMAAACALATGTLFSASPAFAAQQETQSQSQQQLAKAGFSKADLEYLNKSFESLGVPSSKRQGLIDKFVAGKRFDADKGIAPVKTDKVTNFDGSVTVFDRWADGSATKTTSFPQTTPETAPPSGIAAPASVTGCSTTNGSGFFYKRGCQVWHQAITWSGGFTADFRYSLNTGHYIQSIRNPKTGGIGMGEGTLSYIKRSAKSGETAVAQLKARQTTPIVGIPTSRDVGVYLRVNHAGGSTSSFGS